MNAAPAFGSLVALVGVIALIPLALWLLKRTPLGGGAAHGPMRLVGTLALGPSQRLVTVEVGSGDERCWLVLSVGPSGTTTLHTMPPPHDDSGADSPATSPAAQPLPAVVAPRFARLLATQRAKVRADGRHDGARREDAA